MKQDLRFDNRRLSDCRAKLKDISIVSRAKGGSPQLFSAIPSAIPPTLMTAERFSSQELPPKSSGFLRYCLHSDPEGETDRKLGKTAPIWAISPGFFVVSIYSILMDWTFIELYPRCKPGVFLGASSHR